MKVIILNVIRRYRQTISEIKVFTWSSGHVVNTSLQPWSVVWCPWRHMRLQMIRGILYILFGITVVKLGRDRSTYNSFKIITWPYMKASGGKKLDFTTEFICLSTLIIIHNHVQSFSSVFYLWTQRAQVHMRGNTGCVQKLIIFFVFIKA